jgi:hypothetical protein
MSKRFTRAGYCYYYLKDSATRSVNEAEYTLMAISIQMRQDYGKLIHGKPIPFPAFIDYISPALFLNLGFIDRSSWGALILREE